MYLASKTFSDVRTFVNVGISWNILACHHILRQLCEKFPAKGRVVYLAFLDLEKGYARVDSKALWQVVNIYGVRGSSCG